MDGPQRVRTDTAPGQADEIVALPAARTGAPPPGLPMVLETASPLPRRRLLLALTVVAFAAIAAGAGYWWIHRLPALPPGIAFGNGRIEADPIDVATKFAGRIAELRVDEGDTVTAGQPLAVMDTRDLSHSLKKAQAEVDLQQKSISGAEAALERIRTQRVFAEQQIERTQSLLKNGWTTQEVFDQRRPTRCARSSPRRTAAWCGAGTQTCRRPTTC
jgi:HlyD family secretion protein